MRNRSCSRQMISSMLSVDRDSSAAPTKIMTTTSSSSPSSSSTSSHRTVHDLPLLRARSIPSSFIRTLHESNEDEKYGMYPIPLTPKQLRLTRKEIQRFLSEVEHPLHDLDQSIPLQSTYDQLHSIFLEATPLPTDLIDLIREYRLEVLPSQPLLISAQFGPRNRDSRPFNTAAIVTSRASVIHEQKRFCDEAAYLSRVIAPAVWKHRTVICVRYELDRAPAASVAAASDSAISTSQPTIIHSLSTLLYSGLMIREIWGYYGRIRLCKRCYEPSCFGVKFVYGPQIEVDQDEKEEKVEERKEDRRDSERILADRTDLGFVMSSDLPVSRGYRRSHMRLDVDEYITRVTLQIGSCRYAVALIFETNQQRRFAIGPEVDEKGVTDEARVSFEYIIDTPPDYALIALTGTEGQHIHAIRGVYAAISKPRRQPNNSGY